MDKRKEELEKKRQKLAELRKAREQRKTAAATSVISTRREVASPVKQSLHQRPMNRQDVDQLVSSLVGTRKTPKTEPVLEELSRKNIESEKESKSKRKLNLSLFQASLIDIPPKEVIKYDKEVQTSDHMLQGDVNADTNDTERGSFDEILEKQEAAIRRKLIEEELPKMVQDEVEKINKNRKQLDLERKPIVLSTDEASRIMSSPTFISFFDNCTKMVEKSMNEEYDVFRDYKISSAEDGSSRESVKLIRKFHSPLVGNRNIIDCDWSPSYPELCLASYNSNKSAITDPDGLVLVWNHLMPERPEFKLYAQAKVTAAKFSPFHPNLIAGGTYSGQILIWDTRTSSSPVLKSPLTLSGHTHPISSLSIVGTQNANNLVSCSNDGLFCAWQMDFLAKPIESLPLSAPTEGLRVSEELPVTTFQFPENETATFWIGSEDGSLYQVNRHDRADNKAGVVAEEKYSKHYGAITGLDFHPVQTLKDFSDLYLTSSVDWTINLWKRKPYQTQSTSNAINDPILTFDASEDYIFDVKWSPIHPAVFVSVDGSGKFDLWNLNINMEAPISSKNIGENSSAINKVAWNNDGQKCALASSDGNFYIYEINEEICRPKPEDFTKLQGIISDISKIDNI